MNEQHERNSMEKVKVRKVITDLGQAAYLKMHGFKCIGRKSRNYYFEPEEEQVLEFDQLCIDYSNSAMHDFDSELMSLKKLPEYLPEK